ncbi:MAG: GDP-mannose 4,6-dehydratase [Lachnospiraceae bacterium]|nr:GDP-mannose 4,6-dehydratase [Lachnospiraceae bacterium]
MKKVLIFGGGGFVGSYLALELKKSGYEVFGSDQLEEDAVNSDNLSAYSKANLLNKDEVEALLLRVEPDAVINLAAISSVGASWNIPQLTMEVNVVGALNIMEAARKLENMPRLMFIGSSEEYEAIDAPISEETALNANNPYGISKMTQERFAAVYRERYGMKIFCVRPFNHTGIGQKDTFVLPSFCKQAAEIEKSGKPGVIHVGNLATKRDFSDVRDIVRAYRMILESDNDSVIYNVGSGKAYSLQEMLDYIVGLSKQKIEVEVDKERFRPIDTPLVVCDHSKIEKDLGWKPEYSILDTLKEIFQYYVQN